MKISALPQDTSPTGTDYFPTVDAETGQTKRVLLSDLASYLYGNNPYPTEGRFDFVASGGVWTADAAGSTRAASMTALVVYINGRRISITAVTARTFTASVDTYIDVLDNGDGTGTLVYTTAVNNAASPALAANSIRIGIIVTGATTIAAAASVNQGQEDHVLPIASSVPYSVNDSLGNLICPRDPNRRLLGYRQVLVSQSATSTTYAQVTGLSCPIIPPTNRKIKITGHGGSVYNSNGTFGGGISIWDGTVPSGTQLDSGEHISASGFYTGFVEPMAISTPTTATKTYNAGLKAIGGGTFNTNASSTQPVYVMVELE